MKSFLLNDKNISRNSFLWNLIGSFFYAFQSTIILVVMTRTISLNEAGIFTFAYANANFFLIIGHYGIRNYQVSDVRNQFSFREYHVSRIFTVAAMVIAGCIFVLLSAKINHYSHGKVQIMIWMILLKSVDAYEGVFHGHYQKNNRLDVAGRCLSLRMIFLIMVYGCSIIITHNQLLALIISTLTTIIVFIVLTLLTKNAIISDESTDEGDVYQSERGVSDFVGYKFWMLIIQCFPLFLGCFLSFYVGNAPKYAIDAILTGDSQACYGFISMPVFVVELLTGFIYMPQMYRLSKAWDEKNIKDFKRMIIKQILIVMVITVVCLFGAFIMGIPVLSIVFNTDLHLYKTPLLILIIGGGFLGLNGFLNAVITIIRRQKYSMFGYVFVALLVFLFSGREVSKHGITGAAILYTVSMMAIMVFFMFILIIGLRNCEKSEQ